MRTEAPQILIKCGLSVALYLFAVYGRKFLSAGGRVVAKENGLEERTILIEFESFEAAVNAYESEAYQKVSKSTELTET